MKIKYIILFFCIFIIYILINSIEPFAMIGLDSNGSAINVSSNCTYRKKDQCEITGGCIWKDPKCLLKKDVILGYGKRGINVHVPTRCKERTSQNCEATHGCSWNKKCVVTDGWQEEKNLNGKVVHFPKKCSQRSLNFCMIGPKCYLNGGLCHDRPNTSKFEHPLCQIDRKNITIGKNVYMCRNMRKHWTPELDKINEKQASIPIIKETRTCWHCPI